MAGYLDHYGAGEERRERLIKTAVLVVLAVLVVGGTLYFIFKNYRQEQQVKLFFENLAKQDYKTAYAQWGCTESKPCSAYPFPEFMKDWGPQTGKRDFKIAKSRACGSGVIITVNYVNREEDKLWVERGDLTLGFSPLPGCPAP